MSLTHSSTVDKVYSKQDIRYSFPHFGSGKIPQDSETTSFYNDDEGYKITQNLFYRYL